MWRKLRADSAKESQTLHTTISFCPVDLSYPVAIFYQTLQLPEEHPPGTLQDVPVSLGKALYLLCLFFI